TVLHSFVRLEMVASSAELSALPVAAAGLPTGENAVAFRDAGWAAGVRGVGSGVGRAIGLFTGAGAVAVAAVSRGA
ncbi:hypothetical protein, partial [Pseudomonas viridiflava]|uniref:hypothetical protein n=1 Tax=Pseudomonas viridiflava TaxID=33069 RepID=UPI00197E6737